MPSGKPLGRGSIRVRRRDQRLTAVGEVDEPVEAGQPVATAPAKLSQNWRSDFLAQLAETSNVRKACDLAGVSPTTVYDLRRRDPGFAQRWLDALCEGYDNLEMEMLYHLRTGESDAGSAKFNFAVALRMLMAHRETVGREKARRVDVNVEEIRASIELKVSRMRDRVLARRAREAGEIDANAAD